MMKFFQGRVSQLHSVAITHQNATSHQSSLRVGEHTVRLNTGSMPAIHVGDEVSVCGVALFGSVRPVVLRNDTNGYETGFVNLRSIVISGVVAAGLLAWGAAGAPAWVLYLGGFAAFASGLTAAVRHAALSAMRSALKRQSAGPT